MAKILIFIIIKNVLKKVEFIRKNIILLVGASIEAELLRRKLNPLEAGQYCLSVAQGLAGLKRLNLENECDALLLDSKLPIEALQEILQCLAVLKQPPVVLALFQSSKDLKAQGDFLDAVDDYLLLDTIDAADWEIRIARLIERQKRQRSLERNQALLDSLLDTIPDAVYFKDAESCFIKVSKAMLSKYGHKLESIIGMSDFDLFTEEHARPAYEDELKIMRTGTAMVGKLEKETLVSGMVKWVNTTKVPLRDEKGHIIGTLGISRDVSDLHETQKKLQAERNLLQSVLNNLPDRIYVKDAQGRYLRANPAQIQFLEVSSEAAIVGKTILDHKQDELSRQSFAMEAEVISQIKPILNIEDSHEGKNGKTAWYLTSKVPFFDEQGFVVGTIGISRDITQQKQTEIKLREAIQTLEETKLQMIEVEKFNTIGRMAAGIAHEVKNPLAVVSLGLEYLDEKVSSEAGLNDLLTDMKSAVEKANTIIFDLLDYSASRKVAMEAQDMNQQILRVQALMRHNFEKGGVRVNTDYSKRALWVKMEPSKIEQVFMNLFLNALAVMPNGGQLTVRTREERMKQAGSNVSAKLTERFRIGDRIVIVDIEDTGCGIDSAHEAKLFDPFFSTRSTEDGTGLGLSVARSIVEMHGGIITLENRPDQRGARARLIFPKTQKP